MTLWEQKTRPNTRGSQRLRNVYEVCLRTQRFVYIEPMDSVLLFGVYVDLSLGKIRELIRNRNVGKFTLFCCHLRTRNLYFDAGKRTIDVVFGCYVM